VFYSVLDVFRKIRWNAAQAVHSSMAHAVPLIHCPQQKARELPRAMNASQESDWTCLIGFALVYLLVPLPVVPVPLVPLVPVPVPVPVPVVPPPAAVLPDVPLPPDAAPVSAPRLQPPRTSMSAVAASITRALLVETFIFDPFNEKLSLCSRLAS
jgi:hypothetical protein